MKEPGTGLHERVVGVDNHLLLGALVPAVLFLRVTVDLLLWERAPAVICVGVVLHLLLGLCQVIVDSRNTAYIT